jgi:outer membrane protein
MRTISRMAQTAVVIAGLVATSAAAQGVSAPTAGSLKFAFIRSQDIFAKTPGRAEAEAQFNKEVETARAQEKVMGDSVNALLGDYARTESTLSADAKTARQAAIREKQGQFQQRQQALEQQVQQRQTELVQPILQRINGIIEDVRAQGGYAFIFDAQANGGGIVAADKSLDVTDQVIARLAAAGPAPTATTPSAGTPSRTPTRPTTGPTTAPSGVARPKNQ